MNNPTKEFDAPALGSFLLHKHAFSDADIEEVFVDEGIDGKDESNE